MPRIPAALRQSVVKAAQGRCAYCHSPEALMGVEFEIDHIVPRDAGGKTTADNLCLSCPTCNRHKAARSSAIDPATRRIVPLFHPKRDRWADHFAWSENGARLVGLTPTGRATVEALHVNRPTMMSLRRYWHATGIDLDEQAHNDAST